MTETEVISMTPAISMTANAARRVAEIATKLGKDPVLRLSVDGGGCSGFQYRFGLADSIETDDIQAQGEGASLVVDPISLDLVRVSILFFSSIFFLVKDLRWVERPNNISLNLSDDSMSLVV